MEVKLNSLRAWMLAARPKTLSAAIIPVVAGSSLAYADGEFRPVAALMCLLFAGFMQIAANFINDLFDFMKGTDREDRLGPERAMAQGWISKRAMKYGIAITIILACAAGCVLIYYGGAGLIALGAICVIFAFLYTWTLSYRGWGDLLVLVFFGFAGVGGTYYVQTLAVSYGAVFASLAIGLATDTLLIVNNYRDRDADRISGKRTIVVRCGERFGSALYLLSGIAAVLCCFWFGFAESRWAAALLPMLYLVPHIKSWRQMVAIGHGRELNAILGKTSVNMLFFGLLLSCGLIIS